VNEQPIPPAASMEDVRFFRIQTPSWSAAWLGTDGLSYGARHLEISKPNGFADLVVKVEAFQCDRPATVLTNSEPIADWDLPGDTNVLKLIANGWVSEIEDYGCMHPLEEVKLQRFGAAGYLNVPKGNFVVCEGCGTILSESITDARLFHDSYHRLLIETKLSRAELHDMIRDMAELGTLDVLE
jgi:hypothetical protein